MLRGKMKDAHVRSQTRVYHYFLQAVARQLQRHVRHHCARTSIAEPGAGCTARLWKTSARRNTLVPITTSCIGNPSRSDQCSARSLVRLYVTPSSALQALATAQWKAAGRSG